MSRKAALRVLISCRTNGAWADAALNAQIRRDGLSGADAALCSRIVYGVLQNQLLLDHYPDPPILQLWRQYLRQCLQPEQLRL